MEYSHLFNSNDIEHAPYTEKYVLDLKYELRKMVPHRADAAINKECIRIEELLEYNKNAFNLSKLSFELTLKHLELYELLPLNISAFVYDYNFWVEVEEIFLSKISEVDWEQVDMQPLSELEKHFETNISFKPTKVAVINMFYGLNHDNAETYKYFRMHRECVDIMTKIQNTPYDFFPKGEDEHKKNAPWIRKRWHQIRKSKKSDRQADIQLMAEYKEKFGYTISKRTIERNTDRK